MPGGTDRPGSAAVVWFVSSLVAVNPAFFLSESAPSVLRGGVCLQGITGLFGGIGGGTPLPTAALFFGGVCGAIFAAYCDGFAGVLEVLGCVAA